MTRITIPAPSPVKVTIPARPEKRENAVPRVGCSIQEAAMALGVSEPSVSQLINEEKIRTVKIGKRIIVSIESLRNFVDGEKI